MTRITAFFTWPFRWARAHKFIATILLILIGWGGYAYFGRSSTNAETRYVLASAEQGTLITSVTGSGQVSVTNQVDVKPRASGDITSVLVAQGQYVSAGAVIAQVDSADAEKSVRDAQSNLDSARLTLQKLMQSSADAVQIADAAYVDISSAFLDFPTIVTAADEIIMDDTLNPRNQANNGYYRDFVRADDSTNYLKVTTFVDRAIADYKAARTAYDATILLYKNTLRTATPDEISALLEKTTETTKAIAQALFSEQNLLDFLSDYGSTYNKSLPSLANTYKTNLRTYIGQVNTHLSALVSDKNSILNAPLDIASQQLSITRSENTLADAKQNLENYYIRAPFTGVVAKLSIKKGESVSASTVAAIVITAQKIAEVSLNEVDIAKIAAGQKATLTFDAVPDLTLAGTVTMTDSIGTVTQGVVNYTVTVGFDTQDARVRPGMSVSAAIVSRVKPDVLLVPSGAVKTSGSTHYVEVLDAYRKALPTNGGTQGVTSLVAPSQVEVEVGVSNDTQTEITGGLSAGDVVVVRTITGVAATTASSQAGGFRLFGGGGAGGGVRPTAPVR